MVDMKGKHIVITGASGGMGSILTKRLADMGAKLSLCSNDEGLLNKLKEEINGKTEVFSKVIDITDEAQVEAFIEESYKANGEFYGLLNLAGLSIPGQIPETPVEAFDTMMDVNVKGTFLTSKHFAHHAQSPAVIINIGSMAAINANGNAPLYCTAKAAVNMLSKALLLQVASKKIRVTTVNPGGADTAFWGDRKVDRTKLMSADDVCDIIMFVLTSNPNVQIHEISFESMAKF
ncbi:MAG: SDR family NAD(P)-dependent oxidoreductase [Ruminococcaceae bacterium]|nr:SDR family NAD(P)-dependent oxidoreductase [Oscillospiraceae bacterium]